MKKLFTKLLAVVCLISVSTFSVPALAALDCTQSNLTPQQAIQCGANGASGTGQTSDQATSQVNGTIKTIINILSVAVGVTAVIMIIIAGFRYVTSGGKQESVANAKNTILYAIIGLVVVALAQIIVRFVLTQATTNCINGKTPSGQQCS
ncbi:MAG TPA: pilin [Candidatus Saccharimonadales bacterium]|nr:pilin [Candidatus Saccharimonadales bacterium]